MTMQVPQHMMTGRNVGTSNWLNPTTANVELKLLSGGGKWTIINVEPGVIVSIPAEFDSAIHDVRQGVVMGGKGPQLVKVDEKGQRISPGVHRALSESQEAAKTTAEALVVERGNRIAAEKELEATKTQAANDLAAAKAKADLDALKHAKDVEELRRENDRARSAHQDQLDALLARFAAVEAKVDASAKETKTRAPSARGQQAPLPETQPAQQGPAGEGVPGAAAATP